MFAAERPEMAEAAHPQIAWRDALYLSRGEFS